MLPRWGQITRLQYRAVQAREGCETSGADTTGYHCKVQHLIMRLRMLQMNRRTTLCLHADTGG